MAGATTAWNPRTYRDIANQITKHRPDLIHCTNIFPLITTSVHDAARAADVPVVQSLHNFRFLCLNGLLFRQGSPCEKCLEKNSPGPGILRGCYRGHRISSLAVGMGLIANKVRGVLNEKVSAFIALGEFSRKKFIVAGFPEKRIFVKPNFIDPDPGIGGGDGGYAVFVGRLSKEKGVDILLEAWQKHQPGLPLMIIGDGPLRGSVLEAVATNRNVIWKGHLGETQTRKLIGKAEVLIAPSVCYEQQPLVIIEAYSKGTPVITTDLGNLTELVDVGETGYLAAAGDARDLACIIARGFGKRKSPKSMRIRCRQRYLKYHTGAANYEALMDIYRVAMGK